MFGGIGAISIPTRKLAKISISFLCTEPPMKYSRAPAENLELAISIRHVDSVAYQLAGFGTERNGFGAVVATRVSAH
jgi:hypothetical protein